MQEANPTRDLKKLAAIPVLVAILIMVLPKSEEEQEDLTPTLNDNLAFINANHDVKKLAVRRDRNWPELELEDLLNHNPFSNSLLVQEAKSVSGPDRASNIIEVDVYLSSETGTLAMAGETVYRVGDTLPDGRVVDSLSEEYIYLKRLPKN